MKVSQHGEKVRSTFKVESREDYSLDEAGGSVSSFEIFIQYEKRSRICGKRSSKLDMSSVELAYEGRSLYIQVCSYKTTDY